MDKTIKYKNQEIIFYDLIQGKNNTENTIIDNTTYNRDHYLKE
jgi:hypothetical protein